MDSICSSHRSSLPPQTRKSLGGTTSRHVSSRLHNGRECQCDTPSSVILPRRQESPFLPSGGRETAPAQPRCASRKTPQSLREKPHSALGLALETGSQNSHNDPYPIAKTSGRWILLVHLSRALFTSFFTEGRNESRGSCWTRIAEHGDQRKGLVPMRNPV